MKLHRLAIFAFLVGIVCIGLASAQQPKAATHGPKFDEYLAKLKSGDTNIDYRAMRIAFSQSDEKFSVAR